MLPAAVTAGSDTDTLRARPRRRRRPFRALSPAGKAYACAHRRQAKEGRFTVPLLSEIRLAPENRPVFDAEESRAVLEASPVNAALRCDGYRTRLAIIAALVDHQHPETGLIVAGHARLAERASHHAGRRIARSTVGNHVRALVDGGALHVALHGSSRAANGGVRDLAPAYLVVTEAPVDIDVDEDGHLPVGETRTRRDISPPRSTGEFSGDRDRLSPAVRREEREPGAWAPRTADERRTAAAWLLDAEGWWWWLRRHRCDVGAVDELARVCAAFFRSGWSPRAVAAAWRRRPDGEPFAGPLPDPNRRDSASDVLIGNLWGVLTARLAAWRDPLGDPLAPPVPEPRRPRGRPPSPASLARLAGRPVKPPAAPPVQRTAVGDAAAAHARAVAAKVRAQARAGRAASDERRAEARALFRGYVLGHGHEPAPRTRRSGQATDRG